MEFSFPEGFVMGVSSAATQIEGGYTGHSWNDWYDRGHIKDGSDPAVADDHWNRWREDVDLMGLEFGLWFEPEAVNPDSDLFRAHPDWVLAEPGRESLTSRHELLLDLRKEEVRDYIVSSVCGVLDGADVKYVKWDMSPSG